MSHAVFKELLEDAGRIAGIADLVVSDDGACALTGPKGQSVTILHNDAADVVSAVVTLDAEPSQAAALHQAMLTENPGLWVRTGAAFGLSERGEPLIFGGLARESLDAERLVAYIENLLDTAETLSLQIRAGSLAVDENYGGPDAPETLPGPVIRG